MLSPAFQLGESGATKDTFLLLPKSIVLKPYNDSQL